MSSDADDTNAGVSILRVATDALVQEPQSWKWIIERAKAHARGLKPGNLGLEALQELEITLESAPQFAGSPTREDVHAVATELKSDEQPRLARQMTAKALAGQSLLLALRR